MRTKFKIEILKLFIEVADRIMANCVRVRAYIVSGMAKVEVYNHMQDDVYCGLYPEVVVRSNDMKRFDTECRELAVALVAAISPTIRKNGQSIRVVRYNDVSRSMREVPVKKKVLEYVKKLRPLDVYYAESAIRDMFSSVDALGKIGGQYFDNNDNYDVINGIGDLNCTVDNFINQDNSDIFSDALLGNN